TRFGTGRHAFAFESQSPNRTVPAEPRSLARIAGALRCRDSRCVPLADTDLWPGPRHAGWRTRHHRPAGRRPLRTTVCAGAESLRGHSFATAGIRLLDASQVPSRSRPILRTRVFSV